MQTPKTKNCNASFQKQNAIQNSRKTSNTNLEKNAKQASRKKCKAIFQKKNTMQIPRKKIQCKKAIQTSRKNAKQTSRKNAKQTS